MLNAGRLKRDDRRRYAAVAALALAVAGAATASGPERIPFRLEGHNIVVQAELRPGHRLPFAFDSGLSTGSVITREVAGALGLKADSRADAGVSDASGSRSTAAVLTLPRMSVGGAVLARQVVAITPIPPQVLKRPDGSLLAGYIGAPLLQDAVLCIDYSHRRLLRWARGDFDGAGLVSVPLRVVHGLPTISVDIDGHPATLIVDSGNDGAIAVYAAFAQANDFRKRYPGFAPITGSGGSGQTFTAMAGAADTAELGPGAAFQNVPMEVIPQGMDPSWGIDGMLGFRMLQQLDPCIDRDGGRLLFKGE